VESSDNEGVPVKTVQIGADAAQTTCIMGDLDNKLELVVIEHLLKIYFDARPVQKKPQKQFIEGQNFICEEIKKLLDANFIQEVHYPLWPANPVVIPNASGDLWMCIDYPSLTKACPRDPFPLQRIDQIVDSTSGCDLLCFLDAYSSFHQIPMSREDEEHTTFITVDVLFCYVSMPYGLIILYLLLCVPCIRYLVTSTETWCRYMSMTSLSKLSHVHLYGTTLP
jgi:hypothetical protein